MDGNKQLIEKSYETGTNYYDEKGGFIELPYDPEKLVFLFEQSQFLRSNIDAYITNIDGFGHKFVPSLDLDEKETFEKIRTAIILERNFSKETEDQTVELLSDEEVNSRIDQIKKEMLYEKWKLESLFDQITDDEMSFVSLRKCLRQDKEITGNAYLEIRRGLFDQQPARATYLSSITMKLATPSEDQVMVKRKIKISPIATEEQDIERKFNKFVQVCSGIETYFKEYGDPRIMSSKTGKYFKDENEWNRHIKEETNDKKATEIIHFRIHSPRSKLGIPRWTGVSSEVIGSRESSEVNMTFFKEKTIPPMIVTVNNGKLASGAEERLTDYIEDHIKGIRNFHKILVLEADQSPQSLSETSNVPKIEVKELTQRNDAMFQDYEKNNFEEIRMCFRNPSFLLGKTDQTNYATALVARLYAEEQIYQPEREDFDYTINKTIINDLNIKYYKFQTNSPAMKNPELMTDIIEKLVKNNIITPNEARELAKEVLNKDLQKIIDSWAKIPVPLTLAGFSYNEENKADVENSEEDNERLKVSRSINDTNEYLNEKLSEIAFERQKEYIKTQQEQNVESEGLW